MDFEEIKDFVKKRNYLFLEHADEERIKDKLTVEEVEQAVLSGEVVEERLGDPRGESLLIAGTTKDGKIVHVVIGSGFAQPIVVTVYRPDQQKWIRGKIRRRSKQ